LWLLVVPLIALLLTNRLSGFIWTGILIATTCYFFHLENQATTSFRLQIQDVPADYFFTSYLTFFIAIVGIVLIFAKEQSDTIKNLKKQQELLLRQKKEITSQADSLRATQILLEKSNEELNNFAAAAAHDLKEPLRMIKLYTQLTVKRIDQHLDENTREFISYVTDGVTRMHNLLEDLLNYAQLGNQKEDTKNTDLNDILFLVINNLSATMQDTQTAIFMNDLPELKSSSTEMTQLFQNLLSNSIKFRQQNIHPQIHIKHQLDDNQHLISVSDNGIGIAQENQERVFSIFQRLHSREAYEGAGIGLATCKKIVKKMDGKIWASSEIGQGTTFYIKFPSAN
jgi:light-regulated signal transduction histidine kinase (bacteriophytochrome)